MARTYAAFLLLFGVVAVVAPEHASDNVIDVAYLTAAKARKVGIQGLLISGAISLAIEEINNDTALLPDVELRLRWADMKADPRLSVELLTAMWQNGSSVFIGPEDSCATEAFIAGAWNLPMISYVSKKNSLASQGGSAARG